MPTSIPVVRVTPIEAQAGFQVSCSHCPTLRVLRGTRFAADLVAVEHQKQHSGGDS